MQRSKVVVAMRIKVVAAKAPSWVEEGDPAKLDHDYSPRCIRNRWKMKPA